MLRASLKPCMQLTKAIATVPPSSIEAPSSKILRRSSKLNHRPFCMSLSSSIHALAVALKHQLPRCRTMAAPLFCDASLEFVRPYEYLWSTPRGSRMLEGFKTPTRCKPPPRHISRLSRASLDLGFKISSEIGILLLGTIHVFSNNIPLACCSICCTE